MSTKHNISAVLLIVLGVITILFLGTEVVREAQKNQSDKNPYPDISRPIFYNESPQQGDQSIRLVLYEYGDFACPACRDMEPVVEQILTKYVGKLRHVWKDFPVHGELSKNAALAARCAGEQGQFWPYHDWLFANQADLGKLDYKNGAEPLGIKTDEFEQCLKGTDQAKLVERDALEALALGLDTTPTFVVGDRALSGIVSFEDFDRVIQFELGQL